MNKIETFIGVNEAMEIVLATSFGFGDEKIGFQQSLGRVLKEDITADRELPPFDRVSMDGIAIDSGMFHLGKRSFNIEGVQAAGSEQLTLSDPRNCIEAMTGAMLPKGTDAVVPYEQLHIEKGIAHIKNESLNPFQNIHKQGLDRKKGDILIPRNTRISAAEIGVFATVGKDMVTVAGLPKVAIVSTGDELVDVGEAPAPYQIRKSNVYSLESLLQGFGIKPDLFHIPDNREELHHRVSALLDQYDAILFSGAVSKGKFDHLPEILSSLGVEKCFHKVRQRPGKPFWFGKKGKTTIFAFPGNPVSTFVSCLKYFVPWLKKSLQLDPEDKALAVLSEDFHFNPELTYFLQVKLVNNKGILMAIPDPGNGSGDLANLSKNDAFLELPASKSQFHKGEVYPIIPYRLKNC